MLCQNDKNSLKKYNKRSLIYFLSASKNSVKVDSAMSILITVVLTTESKRQAVTVIV